MGAQPQTLSRSTRQGHRHHTKLGANAPSKKYSFFWQFRRSLKFLCRNIICLVSVGAFSGLLIPQNAFAVGASSTTNPAGGAYSAPPDLLAGGDCPLPRPLPKNSTPRSALRASIRGWGMGHLLAMGPYAPVDFRPRTSTGNRDPREWFPGPRCGSRRA